nr:iron uptake system protein EfeO [Conchiformibius kuhniae]
MKRTLSLLPLLLALGACQQQPSAQAPAAETAVSQAAPSEAVAAASSAAAPAALEQALAEYKKYVQEQTDVLVRDTEAFVTAVKAGDLDKAKALYAPARAHYERIEPVASLFEELDEAIDVREDDFKLKTKDPAFGGFHRIEYALWVEKDTKSVAATADKLLNDVKSLQAEIANLDFPAEKVVGGAAELIEEVAADKITGEENRYSHTDLSDFQANVDGSKKIVELFGAQIAAADAEMPPRLQQRFAELDSILAKYRAQDGSFATYDKLSDADRNALKTPLNALAEDLAKLRGLLGLGG